MHSENHNLTPYSNRVNLATKLATEVDGIGRRLLRPRICSYIQNHIMSVVQLKKNCRDLRSDELTSVLDSGSHSGVQYTWNFALNPSLFTQRGY